MKEIRRLIVCLALFMGAMVFTFTGASAAELTTGSCGKNVTYSFDKETGTLTVSGTGDMTNYGLTTGTDSASPFKNNADIKSVVIGSGVTSIGSEAFEKCYNLSSLTISDTVTYIGRRAFFNCESLNSITIPDGVIRIGEHAFEGTGYYNTAENWENNALYIGKALIAGGRNGEYRMSDYIYEGEVEGIYAVKPGTKVIADWAFYQCKKLTGITLPESLKAIGSDVFRDCSSLTEVVIPEGVASINGDCFINCTSLKSVTIPNSVTNIAYGAFKGCSVLEHLKLPDSLTALGDYAFDGCKGLVRVTVPQGVTVISKGLFCDCTNLESVDIGSAVTSIEETAFEGCVRLKEITVPKSVTNIGKDAFKDCGTKLAYVTMVFTIKGYKNSYAASYASKNKIKFIELAEQQTPTTKPKPTAKPNQSDKNRKEVIKGKAPKVKVKGKAGKISIKYTASKKAAGFQVRYKSTKGKWTTKTFKAKKSTTKILKKLKKGRYTVQVRSFTKGKKTYSKWSKAKAVNVR